MNDQHTAPTWDVTIMGGGLAGLSLSIQLLQAMPKLRVLVVEKNRHPVAEAAHKVGESSIEAGAHYLAEVIGMRQHLEEQHYIKPGLRFYFPSTDGNSRIENRVEHGDSEYPDIIAYQIDRGRFENELAKRASSLGVEFLDDARVTSVDLNPTSKTVSYVRNGEQSTVTSRWFIDASGRRRYLAQKLGLKQDANHRTNAVWFRVDGKIDIDAWSSEPRWRNRREADNMRFHSTNHLMGIGRWVWLIPLAPDRTSVGIVADERYVDLNDVNTLEKALAWLRKEEPQCFEQLKGYAENGNVLDFKVLKHYAHNCEQVFSSDRWALTGEAGIFVDPMYSSGSDSIAFSNTYITKLIETDLQGEDIGELASYFNATYLAGLGKHLFNAFRDLYPAFGNAQVFCTKITWDTYWYWAGYCLLFFQNKITDRPFMDSIRPELERLGVLASCMQSLFRDWHAKFNPDCGVAFVDQALDVLIDELHLGLHASFDSDDALRQKLRTNLMLVEQVAQAMFVRMARSVNLPLKSENVNPYALSLDPERWESDGVFDSPPEPRRAFNVNKELAPVWIAPNLRLGNELDEADRLSLPAE